MIKTIKNRVERYFGKEIKTIDDVKTIVDKLNEVPSPRTKRKIVSDLFDICLFMFDVKGAKEFVKYAKRKGIRVYDYSKYFRKQV